MPSNALRHHHDPHDRFLDNNFPTILEYHGELQNEHRACQFPFRMQ